MLSWNEIRDRATRFSRAWAEETDERREAQSFWNSFFDVFGVERRTVARYEERVKLLRGGDGRIDLFWPGVLIVEQKSAGKDLDSAYEQAGSYFDALSENDRPRYIIVSDFARIRIIDLEGKGGKTETSEFSLSDLPKYIRSFGFIAGYRTQTYHEEDPINLRAAEKISHLVDTLAETNYPRENLPKLLTRLVFCRRHGHLA